MSHCQTHALVYAQTRERQRQTDRRERQREADGGDRKTVRQAEREREEYILMKYVTVV